MYQLDKTALATYDTLGCYFVDCVYNNHYQLARERVVRGGAPHDVPAPARTLTDAYRGVLISYARGVREHEYYMTTIRLLHEYFQKHAGVMTFMEFEDKILREFIPPEYYRDFTNGDKETALRALVQTSVGELIKYVLTPHTLRRIIDAHKDKANVRDLQDQMIEIFTTQRENYYAKFVSANLKPATVDKTLFDRLKSAFKDTKRENLELADAKKTLLAIVNKIKQSAGDLYAQYETLTNDLAALREDYNAVVIERNQLRGECAALRSECDQLRALPVHQQNNPANDKVNTALKPAVSQSAADEQKQISRTPPAAAAQPAPVVHHINAQTDEKPAANQNIFEDLLSGHSPASASTDALADSKSKPLASTPMPALVPDTPAPTNKRSYEDLPLFSLDESLW